MEKRWIVTGLSLLILGIILGAFGAHALKDIITDPEKLASFETAVRYQLINSIAFLIIPFIAKHFAVTTKAIFGLLLTGVLFFCVSIYLLTLKDQLGLGGFGKVLGPVTPLGGLLMIIGWTILLVKVVRKR